MTDHGLQILYMLGYTAAALLLCLAATWVYLRANEAYFKSYAYPTARAMHTKAIAVGGGWPLVATIILLWLTLWPLKPMTTVVLAATSILAIISWVDDLRPLLHYLRFAAQTLAVALVLVLLGDKTFVFSESWPLWTDRLVTAFCWIWFINLYNFMDGIDGLAGLETIVVSVGLALVGFVNQSPLEPVVMALIVGGAAAGFLVWNWHPARLFLGDVGSVPLGFLIGWLLIDLAISGYLAAAFILPFYFLGDATMTLVKRITRGEKFWQPHRQHYYQQAVLAGWSPNIVVKRVTVANLALILLAFYSVQAPLMAVAMAFIVVFSLFFLLGRMARLGP